MNGVRRPITGLVKDCLQSLYWLADAPCETLELIKLRESAVESVIAYQKEWNRLRNAEIRRAKKVTN